MSYSGSAKAREARELLGRALAIVQLDPAIPPEAAPVSAFMAQAVGSLFVAEMAPNDAAGLSAVRGSLGLLGQALAQIQQVPGPVPALESAMGTMAHAMGVLFPLTTLGEPAPAPVVQQPAPAPVVQQPAPAPVVQQPAPAPVVQRPAETTSPTPAAPHAPFDSAPPRGGKSTLIFAEIGSPEISITASGGAAIPYAEASVAHAAVPQAGSRPASAYAPVSTQPSAPAYIPAPEPTRPAPQPVAPQETYQAPQSTRAAPEAQQPYPATPEPHAREPHASPARPERQVAQPEPARVPTPLPALPTRPYEAPPAVSIDGRPKVEVNVGARTTSNFWVGFDDEVGHGGVFFATYETAPLGSPVALFVTLPAGVSFTTAARVRFVRELSDGASTPGLGFAFEGLAHEHRELVRRFAERREPLFFDEG